jgi:hypothetical protein
LPYGKGSIEIKDVTEIAKDIERITYLGSKFSLK